MSRYLVQLARETRSKLRPPSNLRLAPRAPAIYEEVHEERPVSQAPAAREFSRAPSPEVGELRYPGHPPAPLPGRPEIITAPMRPTLKSPEPDGFVPPAREHRVEMTRPAAAAHSTTSATPRSRPDRKEASQTEQSAAPPADWRREPRAMVQEPAPRGEARGEMERETTMVHSESFLLDDGRRTAEQPRSREFAIPEPVRTRLRQEPDWPAAAARRVHSPAPIPAREPPTQPVIDVTIGKVEVIIESDTPPPLRAIRRQEARGAAPARPAPPLPGPLVRQYLDR